jgi:hypothetical protein
MTTEEAKRRNREKQARWRQRHPELKRERRAQDRRRRKARLAAEMARLNPWVAELASLASLAEGWPPMPPEVKAMLRRQSRKPRKRPQDAREA